MNDLGTFRTETLGRLDVLLEAEGLPAKAQANGQTLLDKLRAPVRIGLFGLPDSGKRAMLMALGGEDVLDPMYAWPTLELAQGPKPRTEAMLSDGAFLRMESLPDTDLLRKDPVFLRLTSTSARLSGRVLLLVASDAQAGDLMAGLSWAAPRVDLTLWCTRSWTPFERQIWKAAPDSLRNHAILLFTQGGSPIPAADINAAEDGFDTAFSVGSVAERDFGHGDFRRFADHLSAIIDEATTQDIHAAHMFLRRYNALPTDRQPTAESARPEIPRCAPPRAVTRPCSRAPAQAKTELTRLFQMVRTSAEHLRMALPPEPEQVADPDRLLTEFETIFDGLADRANDFEQLQDVWPDLVLQMNDARDLALLLRVEGGAAQLTDAAHLLLQLRHEMEERLAA